MRAILAAALGLTGSPERHEGASLRRVGLRLAAACLLCALVLSACGSSATPSAGNPAPLAPANALIYLELTVRPQGSQQAAAESGLTRLLGHSPDGALQRAVNKTFRRSGLQYPRDFKPWLGQKVAVVVTSFTRGGFALIAPTNDPADALSAMRRGERRSNLVRASYEGVRYQTGLDNGTPVALGIVGGDAVVGGPPVFRAIVDAYHGRSLAAAPAFSSALAELPANSLVKGYVNATAIQSELRGRLASLPATPTFTPSARAAVLSALGRLRGTLAFSLSVASRALMLQVDSSSPRHSVPADVGSLPGASWLAVALSPSPSPGRLGLLSSELTGNPRVAAVLARLRSHLGIDVVGDVLPALGPLELSVQGTSATTLGAGLAVSPYDLAAAARLLAAIHRLAQRSHSLAVSGSATSFSITKAGLPIPRVLVAIAGRRLLATFDEGIAELLTPSVRLGSSPDFSRALGSLPAGSRVSVFLDFRELDVLLSALPGFTSSPRNQKALKVLQRLAYLVLGESPTTSTSRLVLGLS